MSEPQGDPLGMDVWRQGAALGLRWLIIFAGIAVAVFVIMGIGGWPTVARALCAMALGPVLGGIGIAVWWLIRRPALRPDPGSQNEVGGEKADGNT